MIRFVLIISAFILSACAESNPPSENTQAAEPTVSAKLMLPEPSGPHAIGVVDFELTDNGREETFAPGTPRRIPVRAWFPASSVSGAPKLYANDLEMEHVIRASSRVIPQSEAAIAARENLPTHSYEQAVPLDAGARPTVIFSHGGTAWIGSNTALMEHLASYGHLVLSISHPYFSAATFHENGDIVPLDQGLLAGMMADVADPDSRYMDEFLSPDIAVRLDQSLRNSEGAAIAAQFKIWEEDFVHVIDRLESGDLPEQAQKLLPLVDMSRLGTFGMSFGASGSATAHQDDRIKAAVNIDGKVFDSALVDMDIGIPVLVFHFDPPLGGLSAYHSEFVYEPLATIGTNPDIIRIETKGATHIAYTDYVLLPPDVRVTEPDGGASLGTIDGERMTDIVNQFVRRFFDERLSGEGSGLDAEFRPQYPEVVDVDVSAVREWAAGNPEPGFMSQTHVFQMNRRLAVDEASMAAAAKLDRRYLMVYELTDSLRGGPEWWQVSFDPEIGVRFSLQEPVAEADLKFTGDYREYIGFMKKLSAGEANEADMPVTTSGNVELMNIVGETFGAARQAATIKTAMPDI